jgi:hypothetical protein
MALALHGECAEILYDAINCDSGNDSVSGAQQRLH